MFKTLTAPHLVLQYIPSDPSTPLAIDTSMTRFEGLMVSQHKEHFMVLFIIFVIGMLLISAYLN